MRILVTGSAGFIGRHLVEELTVAGHEVGGIDLNDAPLTTQADLLGPNICEMLIPYFEPEVVVHLAAQVGRQFNEDEPVKAIESNAAMTALVAKATVEANARLVYTSTSEIYGDHSGELCEEDTLPGEVRGLYSLSKRWGEEVSKLYAPSRLQIVRPSMPYGPGAPPGRGRRALDNMLWQAHHRMPIPVHVGAARSWCWIGDAMRGFRLVIEKGEQPGAYNLGRADAEVTMLHVAELACKLAGAPGDLIDLAEAPPAQTVVKRLSTARLESLGWKPDVELEQGMAIVYDWICNYDNEGRWVGPEESAA